MFVRERFRLQVMGSWRFNNNEQNFWFKVNFLFYFRLLFSRLSGLFLVLSLPAVCMPLVRDKRLPCLPISKSIFPRVKYITSFQDIYALAGGLIWHTSSTTYLIYIVNSVDKTKLSKAVCLLWRWYQEVCSIRSIQNFIICDKWSQLILKCL